ncbi:MAG: UDP-N-acetylmuramoyl-L-alanine--D-glutamate ligase, partial [Microgenomates group bacterium]
PAAGGATARFFAELGAKVIVTDKKSQDLLSPSLKQLVHLPIEFHLGGHHLVDFLNAEIIFKGPSVPWTLPEIVAAQRKNIPIEMELSFFAKYCPAKIIGITGTRGKSTTANLIFQILKQSGFSVYLGGNLPGISTINFLKTLDKKDFIVMELSSWALSGFHRGKISPHISVFTNFYPDHLNYYKNLADYLYDKKAIFMYQGCGDYLIVNKELKKFIAGFKTNQNIIFFDKNSFPYNLKYLKGSHNQENAAASLQVAKILEIDEKKAVKIISQFKGLPFRQEVVGRKNGVTFINDSTSTTPIATVKAIENFSHKPIYLILGGNSKNLPFDTLAIKLTTVKKIILIAGSFTQEILPTLKRRFPEKLTQVYYQLKPAVLRAYQSAKSENGESYVLFSPAATSFSMFNNEFERGKEFNRIVNKILNPKSEIQNKL